MAGILNGTCNYILSRMAATDESMDVVLADAQRLGYAEADPTADVDGHDAAAKLVVLAGIAFRRHVQMADIPKRRSGRSAAPTSATPGAWAARSARCRRFVRRTNSFHAFVGPVLVPDASSFGRNMGANNVVTIYGRYGGESAFSGAGAGGPATAVAVVSDLLALTQRSCAGRRGVAARSPWARRRPGPTTCDSSSTIVPASWRRLRPRSPARASTSTPCCRSPDIRRTRCRSSITVEACEEAALLAALEEISQADWHAEPPLALPMLMGEHS